MIAATVVSTWSLNVRSATSRLLRAMWICRELMVGPKPCSRCWVTEKPSEEVVDGLKSLRGLLLVVELLFKPRLTMVPVRNPFCRPKFERSWRWISDVVPVMNVLLCGVGWCAQLALPVRMRPRLGIAGPEDCSTPVPTADDVPALVTQAAVRLLV